MKLILVVIAFIIDTNVIAGPASFWSMENEIIVLNACSQDPPCLVSYIIGFEDVKLFTSPILVSAETSYFPYVNTTNGIRVTIFKHIDVQDPGTIIITKKLGDDGDTCFVVRGDYSTPKISKCLKVTGRTSDDLRPSLRIVNLSSPTFVAKVRFYEGKKFIDEYEVYGAQSREKKFYVTRPDILSFSIEKREFTSNTFETIKSTIPIGKNVDICIEISGDFSKPVITSVVCAKIVV